MSLRALGSLLTRAMGTGTQQAARSRQSSSRDLAIRDVLDGVAVFTAAALAGAGVTLAVQYVKKGTHADESAGKMIRARKELTGNKVITWELKKLDMKQRFEQWIMMNEKTYRDDEEKAMRFQLFKDTVEWIESQPPSVQKRMLPEITFFADFTEQERKRLLAYPEEADRTVKHEFDKYLRAKYEKGESLAWRPAVKQGDKQGDNQATQVSA